MKGVIMNCMAEMIKQNFSEEKWQTILQAAGLPRETIFFAPQDVEDAVAMGVLECACSTLDMSLAQAADAFGDYWMNVFAPRIYGAYFLGVDSAREFLLKMDRVHEATTRGLPGARPPRFEYEWRDDRTLIIKYHSQRGLIDLMIGLIKGVGKHYGEDLQVKKLGPDAAEVVFSQR